MKELKTIKTFINEKDKIKVEVVETPCDNYVNVCYYDMESDKCVDITTKEITKLYYYYMFLESKGFKEVKQ